MNFSKTIIRDTLDAKHALYKLNELAGEVGSQTILFIISEDKKLVGTISDGDIRRGLVKGLDVSESVKSFMRRDYKYLDITNQTTEYIEELKKKRILLVPFLDNEKHIIDIIDLNSFEAFIPVDAFIMAGGKGERLRPLTETIPKPLLKLGDKSIIEYGIEWLCKFGINNFTISVNYLGNQIVDYLGTDKSRNIIINYVYETAPLGTIGSISLMNEWKQEYVLLSNSDLLTNINLKDFFDFFIHNKADCAVASVSYQVAVPYAIFELSDTKEILSLKEKPILNYYSNAGIYLFKKDILKLIPHNTKYDATDFIEHLISLNKKVISYPITGYWLDIGRMEDYAKAKEDIKYLKF